MYNTHKNNAAIKLMSSRSVGKRDINTLLTVHISRISSRLQGRDDEGWKDKENVGQVVPDDKIGCHAEMSLLSISTAFNNAQAGDPRLKPSGMTTNLTNFPALTNQGRDPKQKRLRMTTLLNLSPHAGEGARSADGGAFVSNTPLPRCAVLSPQGGQRTARGSTTRSVIPQACNAGYSGRRAGFTLIELLVVVLIIGILVAIALPQYQFAVLKARTVKAMPALNTMELAQHAYYLEHGEYAVNKFDLDITSDFVKGNGGNFSQLGLVKIDDSLVLQWNWKQSSEHWCVATSSMARRVCQSLGGTIIQTYHSSDTTTYYEIP